MTYFSRLFPFIAFLLLAIFLGRGLYLNPHELPSVHIGKEVPLFELDDLHDTAHKMNSSSLKGHYSLLNVWASWCSACSEEQAFLMMLAKQGMLIYGLNYKDNPLDARQWLNVWGNPYTHTGNDITGKVAMNLGVYGTPETFLIDPQGIIRYRHTGPMNAKIWHDKFLPLITSGGHAK